MSHIDCMVDDAILSRETAYMYQYVTGFQPVQGNLTHWKGLVTDSGGNSAELEVKLPNNFPYEPPTIRLLGSTQHPRAGQNGEITTRSIQNWTPSNHLYSVVREAKSIISTGQFQSIESSSSQQNVEQVLNSQVNTLRTQLQAKKEEYQRLQSQPAQHVASSNSVDQLIEDSLIEVENEAYALEEAYDNLEIKAIDFAMNFVEARKRFYLIQSAKEQV